MPTIPWEPTQDKTIPSEAKGLIIPGGFPEEYAEQISTCSRSIESLKQFFGKLPIYAECGGMLLLGESLQSSKGQIYPMAGLLPFEAKKGSLNVGYRTLIGIQDSLIIKKGDKLVGHEFHRWNIYSSLNKKHTSLISKGNNLLASLNPPWRIKGWGVKEREEGWSNNLVHASWVHLHWISSARILNAWKKSILQH